MIGGIGGILQASQMNRHTVLTGCAELNNQTIR